MTRPTIRIVLALIFLFALNFQLSTCFAATTINSTNHFAYGANLGWQDWRGNVTNGVVIGEYICSGFIYDANVGWISLGSSTPTNGVRYQNLATNDFGVNHDGKGNLRGYAYGANIGWLNFETNGAPKVNLKTGRFSGSVWSANCGWISLSSALAQVQTDSFQRGADSDGDGITDAWELSYTNTLTAFTATSDRDHDGMSDLNEHAADTNPLDANDALRITEYGVAFAGAEDMNTLTWTSKESRNYVVQHRTSLGGASSWQDASGLIAADTGLETTRTIPFGPVALNRYFRVKALKPLTISGTIPIPPQLSITLAGTQPNLSLTGSVGTPYRVEYAASLPATNWTTLTTLVLPTSPYSVPDVEPVVNQGGRFYRAVLVE